MEFKECYVSKNGISCITNINTLHNLKKVVKESQDPSSPQGVKLDHIEKKKIFESIKKIEDKILKIKLAIDKG